MVSTSGVIARDSFTGNGSDTVYVLSMSISNENATQVYLDGVYQSKNNYSTSGSTLTFSTAPPNGTAIEVVHIKAVAASSLNQNNFTGNGTATNFALSQTIDDTAKTFVFIQGVYQEKSTYSISGTTLVFSTPPQNGYTIEVMAFSTISVGNAVIGATDWQSAIKTANFTAVAKKGYFVNTASGGVTVTLPLSPSLGDTVVISDYGGSSATNKITFTSSNNIQGGSGNKVLATDNGSVKLVYSDSTKGWVTASDSNNALVDELIIVNYLVGAGGGAGATNAAAAGVGGGGAGGLRTSYGSTSGGGASAESTLTMSPATNYTVTIGAGGTGSTDYTAATDGSDTVFSTITSVGGGKGGTGTGQGSTGGSGGGSGRNYTSAGGAGTANQGYAGGAGGSLLSGNRGAGGGGGGAAGVGAAGSSSGSGGSGGAGGTGLSVAITGTGTFYAGGGGGGTSSGTGGAGGSSIGGDGGNAAAGGSAAANTASGGGGSGSTGAGGNGGSGIVILRYASSKILTNPGGGLTFTTDNTTVADTKITTFTAGTGNIQFN
jgi:hypothetical protein